MTKFTFSIVMDVRAYGLVNVEADDETKAMELLTASYVADNFEPHGSSEDVDYKYPIDICATEMLDADGEQLEDVYIEVKNGSWEPESTRKVREFIEQMARFSTPDEDQNFDGEDKFWEEVDNDRLLEEYSSFMHMVRSARELLTGGQSDSK